MKLLIIIHLPNNQDVYYAPDANGNFLVAVEKKNARVYTTRASAQIELDQLKRTSPQMAAEIHDEHRLN